MHEYGLCEPIVQAVERRAAGRPVSRARVRVGALHRVSRPAMEQAFAFAAEGTVADGAALDLVIVPAEISCAACGHTGTTDDPMSLCPACGAADVALVGGDDLILESIQLAAADPSPADPASGPPADQPGPATAQAPGSAAGQRGP
jgi:hydrogenase nickel incorporation protein HypA/HybF